MSKVEATAPRRARREAMQRLWPDHPGCCTLRTKPHPDRRGNYEATAYGQPLAKVQCGVELVPLTVDRDYLSVRCPSCRIVTIHQRIVPLNR
jgi:hypothetical protein